MLSLQKKYFKSQNLYIMIIDAKTEASTLRKTKTFLLIVYMLLVVVTAVFLPLDITFKFLICGVLSAFFIIFYWYQYNMKYTYIYFSNNSKDLIFRFYSMQIFFGKPRTIEISKKSFIKYEILTEFFGKRDSLILYQKTLNGIAKYPPISLILLNKKQKKDLREGLRFQV